jgi:acetyltransferase-like isoleucine patch superfamily enzyme
MRTEVLAIVVLPDSMTIVHSDVAGRAVGDYLHDGLSMMEGVEVKVLADGQIAPQAGSIDDRPRLAFPLTPSGAAALAARDVLIVDARAWLPPPLLSRMLTRGPYSGQRRRLIHYRSDMTNRKEITLAVIFPRGQMGPSVVERARTVAGLGLEHVLNVEALASTVPVEASELDAPTALLIDSYADVSKVEGQVLLDRANSAMEGGVRIRDPHHVWLRGNLVSGSDVELDINVIMEGTVVLGSGVRVGANCILKDSQIGANTRINAFSLVENAIIGSNGVVGPYARIRPESSVGDSVQIGNYVEIKNSEIGPRSRINHHAFIGDAAIAEDVTVGAGTITCNHDGVRINRTIIERGAYIGSGCNLVAPVRIGQGATVGAGSTITRDVPAGKLTLARSRQTTVPNWRGPKQS